MAWPWFVVESLPDVGASVALPRDEAKHAFGAKRLGAGDGVTLFDGAGGVADARAHRRARARRLAPRDGRRAAGCNVDRPARAPGERAAEGRPPRDARRDDRAARRPRRSCRSAASGAWSRRPSRAPTASGASRSRRASRRDGRGCRRSRRRRRSRISVGNAEWPARSAPPSSSRIRAASRSSRAPRRSGPDVIVCIGPEGGFTERELELLAAAGATRVSLAASILRIETAAVVAVATLRAGTS
jgi:16S rRNA (uracil1498-N3)-methyltransferase